MQGDTSHIPLLLDREALRGVVRELLAEELEVSPKPAAVEIVDDETRRAVQEQILISHKTYLTRKEAAKYLNVSERSIAEWAARPVNENPFPEEHAGGEPRYRRTAIDAWAAKEKQRQRLKLAG
jgi:hypothetical protein